VITDSSSKTIYVVDIKSPYDLVENFDYARQYNTDKYKAECESIKSKTKFRVILDAICVGSLGSWDSKNNTVLNKLGLKQYEINNIARYASKISIEESSKMYKNHLS